MAIRHYRWSRCADLAFVVFLLACIAAAGAALHYHGGRLEREAAAARLRLLEVDAHYTLDHLERTLTTVSLTLQSLLETGYAGHGAATWNTLLRDALRHAPHLRSLSLLDDHGTVVASSSPANLGLQPPLSDFLPPGNGLGGVLRIGRLHAGRDLADGRAVADAGAAPPTLAFVPVVRSLGKGESGTLGLLATLNVDYFLNRIGTHDLEEGAWVDVLRSDGALLLSTREAALDAATRAADEDIAVRWRAGDGRGSRLETPADKTLITTWRTARVLPLGVLARLDRDRALAEARHETRRQFFILLPLIALAFAGVLAGYVLLRRNARQHIAAQERDFDRMDILLDALPAAVLVFGHDGRAVLANDAWRQFAAARPGLAGRGTVHYRDYARQFRTEAGNDTVAGGIRAILHGERQAFEGEYALHDDATQAAVQIIARPFAHGGPPGAAVLQLDISDRRHAEERNRLLHATLDAAANAIVITDAEAVIQWANPAFTALTGYTPEEAVGHRPSELVKSGKHAPAFYAEMWNTILRGEVWRGEVVNRRKDGVLFDEALTITPVRDRDGRLRHFVAVKEDITVRKLQEHELQRLASTDPLTGASNRRVFMERLSLELARVRRYGKQAALLMLDLDHFKQINDRHGHAAGDATLRSFTTLAQRTLRQTDTLGRLGGEEFAVLLPETDEEQAAELAERVRGRLAAEGIAFGDEAIRVTVSIGIAQLETTDTTPDTVLARADEALYRAKQGGRNRVERTACAR
ncbi:sensor domain-containing diguanylate cyclase [Pseudothauera rhizosphaerae]|uniref:Diguanylate cyclase n=1 Tax=Pseudothauera rhizosphaerae TaxID=2565932 RepID=A0A4S4AS32_9RHOO|nr:diguanylate cyclase [Pseudothauera rhizosphaerae]THF62193.1 diguanylate cyclase [Pseudothauera rhizosphaerae]